MRKTFFRLIASAIATFGLIACGGGDDSSIPNVQTTPEVVKEVMVADLRLTQVPLVITVTPGETSIIARMTADCLTYEGTDSCKIQVPLGEHGLDFDIEISDLKLLYNGQEITNYTNKEVKKGGGYLYRIVPTQLFTVHQKGVIEVKATFSPYATTGEKTAVVMYVEDSSFDKTLELIPAESKVSVLALQHLAPVLVSNASLNSITSDGNLNEVSDFQVTCPVTVIGGCMLTSFDMYIYGATGGSEVRVYVDGNWYAQYYTSGQGNDYFFFNGNYPIQQGQTVTVKISVAMKNGSLYVQNVKALSGGQQIAPQLDKETLGCDKVINGGNCKG